MSGSEEDSNEFIGIISAMHASLRGDIQNVGYQSVNRGSVELPLSSSM